MTFGDADLARHGEAWLEAFARGDRERTRRIEDRLDETRRAINRAERKARKARRREATA